MMLDGGMPIAMQVTANCPDFAPANTAVGLCMRTFSLTVQALNNIPPGWDLGRGLLRFLGLLGIWFFRLLECLGSWFLRSLICHCGDVVFAGADSPLLFIFFWRAFLLRFCHTRPSSTLDRNCPIILEGAERLGSTPLSCMGAQRKTKCHSLDLSCCPAPFSQSYRYGELPGTAVWPRCCIGVGLGLGPTHQHEHAL